MSWSAERKTPKDKKEKKDKKDKKENKEKDSCKKQLRFEQEEVQAKEKVPEKKVAEDAQAPEDTLDEDALESEQSSAGLPPTPTPVCPDLAVSETALVHVAGPLTPESSYRIPPELAQQVLSANSAADIDLKQRNMLYRALDRALQRPGVPPAAVAQWSQATRCNKFDFLKFWVANPTWGSFAVQQTGHSSQNTYSDSRYMWVTRADLFMKYHALADPDSYIDKLLKGVPPQ